MPAVVVGDHLHRVVHGMGQVLGQRVPAAMVERISVGEHDGDLGGGIPAALHVQRCPVGEPDPLDSCHAAR